MWPKKKVINGCNELDGDRANEEYMVRYYLLELSWLQVCIHVFHKSDLDDMHDHPWHFISLVLWRGYYEVTPQGRARKYPAFLMVRRAEHRHRVELVDGKKAVTMCIMFKAFRNWGFICDGKWVSWQRYFIDKKCY